MKNIKIFRKSKRNAALFLLPPGGRTIRLPTRVTQCSGTNVGNIFSVTHTACSLENLSVRGIVEFIKSLKFSCVLILLLRFNWVLTLLKIYSIKTKNHRSSTLKRAVLARSDVLVIAECFHDF